MPILSSYTAGEAPYLKGEYFKNTSKLNKEKIKANNIITKDFNI